MRTIKRSAEDLIIDQNKSILDALALLNNVGTTTIRHNILLVLDDNEKLIGVVNDGDIRRAFLNGHTQKSPVKEAVKKLPIVAPHSLSPENLFHLMNINRVNSMPVVDEGGKVVYVLCLTEFDDAEELVAVVMAGGEGKRLKPLTDKIPKPMLKVGDKPILQIILESLRNSGFKRIILNIRYLGHIIEDYFQDGSAFNLDIKYIHEPKPLGTAGGLGLINEDLRPNSPFLVINGDLLTTLNFEAFRDFHIAAKYDFTLCGRPYEVHVPFGYPVINGDIVTEFREKPNFIHLVNSGIYCVAPDLIDEVPSQEYFDMPDLIRRAIEIKRRVGVFPLREKFHEIGRHESYEDAEEFYQNHFCQKDAQKWK